MSDQSPAPTPAAEPWEPPTSDQEFVFESVDAAPGWVDKSWASFDRGPALAIPNDFYGTGPYTTQVARVGDKVVYTAPKGASPGKVTVIPGEPDPAVAGSGTKKPPAQSNASLEDMLKTGMLTPDQLGADAKAQVAGRSPGMARLVNEGKGAPEAQSVADQVKLD